MNWSPYYVTAASALCILTGLLRFGKLSLQLRGLVIFLFLTLGLEELIAAFPVKIEDTYTRIRCLYIFQRPFEYAVYAWAVLGAGRFPKLTVYFRMTVIVFSGYSVFLFLTGNMGNSAVSITFIATGIGCIVIVLIYFSSVMTSPTPVALSRDPAFWIATALLFFFTGNIIATGFYPQLLRISDELAKSLYKSLNLSLGIVKYLLFTIAFTVSRKPPPGNADQ